jgi:hypothetical protein
VCPITRHSNKFLVDNDVKLILDNDDYWILPKDNPAREHYEKVESHAISRKAYKIADEIWTPSAYLAERMKKINPSTLFTV